jgi:hypothetical protein
MLFEGNIVIVSEHRGLRRPRRSITLAPMSWAMAPRMIRRSPHHRPGTSFDDGKRQGPVDSCRIGGHGIGTCRVMCLFVSIHEGADYAEVMATAHRNDRDTGDNLR